jgi:hypothetical protein
VPPSFSSIVTRPGKRLSSWELLDLAKQNRTLKAELARQGPEQKKQQPEIAYERSVMAPRWHLLDLCGIWRSIDQSRNAQLREDLA